MAKFLFTMLPANDLGLPTRLLPIARVLADCGHEVAVFNPAPTPAKLIEETGLRNLPMPVRDSPPMSGDFVQLSLARDVEHFFGSIYSDEAFVRAQTAIQVDVIKDYDPHVVVDSFGLFSCLAARILHLPLASVMQGNDSSAECRVSLLGR
jgi:UDP:flavonoid glycosyltransferase YjiC (YdhE family)